MISFYIESKPSDKVLASGAVGTLDPSKEEDRKPFFLRALKRCIFRPGQRVRLVNTKKKGSITKIVRDFDQVDWTDNNAHFIIVQWADNSQSICHPGQLTTKKAR